MARRSEDWNAGPARDPQDPKLAREFGEPRNSSAPGRRRRLEWGETLRGQGTIRGTIAWSTGPVLP